jgi:hypothetical protein
VCRSSIIRSWTQQQSRRCRGSLRVLLSNLVDVEEVCACCWAISSTSRRSWHKHVGDVPIATSRCHQRRSSPSYLYRCSKRTWPRFWSELAKTLIPTRPASVSIWDGVDLDSKSERPQFRSEVALTLIPNRWGLLQHWGATITSCRYECHGSRHCDGIEAGKGILPPSQNKCT